MRILRRLTGRRQKAWFAEPTLPSTIGRYALVKVHDAFSKVDLVK